MLSDSGILQGNGVFENTPGQIHIQAPSVQEMHKLNPDKMPMQR